MKRQPCDNCPWRKSTDPHTQIPNYRVEMAENLAHTCRDDGMAVMACHKTTEGKELACVGFVLQVGVESIGVRLRFFGGDSPDNYEVGDADLYNTFEEMHEAHEIDVPPRNRWRA